jgi:hypothetical protein
MMKHGLFGVGLMAAVLAATGAVAEIVGSSDISYPTVADAVRNAPPAPEACLDTAGANTCTSVFLAEDGGQDGEEGLHWRFLWVTADTPFFCVDAATADFRVDCAASDAVRHLEMRLMSCSADQTDCRTVTLPDPRPYRPGPAQD